MRGAIRAGARFRFYGLPPSPPPDRTVVVLGCSVAGEVAYMIEMDRPEPSGVILPPGDYSEEFLAELPLIPRAPTIHSTPLTEAERMVQLGVWRAPRPLRAR